MKLVYLFRLIKTLFLIIGYFKLRQIYEERHSFKKKKTNCEFSKVKTDVRIKRVTVQKERKLGKVET